MQINLQDSPDLPFLRLSGSRPIFLQGRLAPGRHHQHYRYNVSIQNASYGWSLGRSTSSGRVPRDETRTKKLQSAALLGAGGRAKHSD